MLGTHKHSKNKPCIPCAEKDEYIKHLSALLMPPEHDPEADLLGLGPDGAMRRLFKTLRAREVATMDQLRHVVVINSAADADNCLKANMSRLRHKIKDHYRILNIRTVGYKLEKVH